MENKPFLDALERLRQTVEKLDSERLDNLLADKTPEQRVEKIRLKLSKEPAIRHAIDESLSEWVESKTPIVVDDDLTYLSVWDRFYFAQNFGQWILESGFHNPSKTQEQILRWLLIDCWQHVGVLRWKMTLENMEKL